MPPNNNNTEKFFKAFKQLCFKNKLKEISMGMRNDYEKAIEYGSTNVRVGTQIFGKRK